MKLTLFTPLDIIPVDVRPDMELVNFKAFCECEFGMPVSEMNVIFQGLPLLDDNTSLSSYKIKEGDALLIEQSVAQTRNLGIGFNDIQSGSILSSSTPSTSKSSAPTDEVEQRIQSLLRNPDQLTSLKRSNPKLAGAFLSGDKGEFAKVLNPENFKEEQKNIQLRCGFPNDLKNQQLLEKQILQDIIDSNKDAAVEYHPVSFGQVTMLYINCMVNGHSVKAYVDSGAQLTIMNPACARRCEIMRFVDKQCAHIVKGIGKIKQRLIGKVHLMDIQINNLFLQTSLFILEDEVLDMILGLDMLRHHQCCIDLKRNVLVIGTTGAEVPFLSESDINKKY